MLHGRVARVTVRVVPRAGRTAVEAGPAGIVVWVRSAPTGGRATEEARRAMAEALGVPPSRVVLRSGGTSRVKVFEVDGVEGEQIEMRLRAT